VGVLLADASLHMPDFRAGERTFQLLAQVSGRAGRGEVPGEVIVQTYSPNHPAVEAARDAAYERFAAAELADRREAGFPPFVHLVCLTFKGVDEGKVAFVAQAFAKALADHAGPEVVCTEALPAPLARAKGVYRYQLLLRAASVRAMTAPLRAVALDLHPPPEVAWTVDVDAVSIM
jgi:primosomal protein N' (replication factor Y)